MPRSAIKGRTLGARTRCTYCHVRLTQETATGDHVVPRAEGGRANHGGKPNVVWACRACNELRGNTNAAWFKMLLLWRTGTKFDGATESTLGIGESRFIGKSAKKRTALEAAVGRLRAANNV